jgi:hypothetical protein
MGQDRADSARKNEPDATSRQRPPASPPAALFLPPVVPPQSDGTDDPTRPPTRQPSVPPPPAKRAVAPPASFQAPPAPRPSSVEEDPPVWPIHREPPSTTVFTPRPIEATSARSNGDHRRRDVPSDDFVPPEQHVRTNGVAVRRPVEGEATESAPASPPPADGARRSAARSSRRPSTPKASEPAAVTPNAEPPITTPAAPTPDAGTATVKSARRATRKATTPTSAESAAASTESPKAGPADTTSPATPAVVEAPVESRPRSVRKAATDQPVAPARRMPRKSARASSGPDPAADIEAAPARKPRKRAAAATPNVDATPVAPPAKIARPQKRATIVANPESGLDPVGIPSYGEIWAVVRDRPHRAPAALALAAVAHYGTAAADQAKWLRETYPNVGADRLTKVAVHDAHRRAHVAVAAAALPLGNLASTATQLWTHARLVLEIAALHELDPREPARAAEMLALLQIYPDVGAATTAVRGVTDADTPPDGGRNAPALPKLGAVAATLVRGGVARAVPGAGVVLAGLAGTADVADVAARANRFYRAARQHRPPSTDAPAPTA